MLLSGQFAADLDVKALPLVASKDILPRLLNHLVGVSIAFLIGGNDRIGVDVGIAGHARGLTPAKGLVAPWSAETEQPSQKSTARSRRFSSALP
jgi:hypothetical protein